MTEHKYTDEEKILSLLKMSVDVYCNAKLTPEKSKTLLDLINRQKAEIERLHSEVKEKTETIVFLKDQATGWSIDFCNLKKKLNTAKAEAIKEFAEKLKKEVGYFGRAVAVETINDLVKEFTEE